MTEEKFKEFIAKSEPDNKLVFIRLKYSREDKPRYITELYLYDPQHGYPIQNMFGNMIGMRVKMKLKFWAVLMLVKW